MACALPDDGEVQLEHLPESVGSPPLEEPGALERALIDALTAHEGNLSEVARALGKGRTQVQRWMKRFGLDHQRYR